MILLCMTCLQQMRKAEQVFPGAAGNEERAVNCLMGAVFMFRMVKNLEAWLGVIQNSECN